MRDLWDIFLTIREGRRRREIDPTLTMLRECILDSEHDKATDPEIKALIADTLEFMGMLTGWYEQMKALPKPALNKPVRLGARVQTLLGKKK